LSLGESNLDKFVSLCKQMQIVYQLIFGREELLKDLIGLITVIGVFIPLCYEITDNLALLLELLRRIRRQNVILIR